MKNNILLQKLKAVKSFFKLPFVTHKSLDGLIEETISIQTYSALQSIENDLSGLGDRLDDKLDSEDFGYELSQDYDFMELKDQVEELQDNSELSYSEISDESHCISQLIDERNENIISMITELEQNLAVKTEQIEKIYKRLKDLESQSKEIQISKPIEVKIIKD